VKKRPHQEMIEEGKLQAERLRFHTDSIVDQAWTSHYYKWYLKWVFSYIEDEVKRDRFKTFLNNPPFPTVEIVERIWRKRDRIFNAADPYEKIEFNNPELQEDANAYLESIRFNQLFVDEINQYRKTSPNSFWVVDAKPEQTTQQEPYAYIVDIENVIDYYDDAEGLIYVVFEDKKNVCEDYPNGKLIAIDAEKYIVIELDDNGKPNYTNAQEYYHNLGKTPAGQLSNQPIRKQDYQVKSNILVSQLATLDMHLYKRVSKKYLDSYMFPIIEKIEEECNYRDEDGTQCEGGYIYSRGAWVEDSSYADGGYYNNVQKECPDCKARRIIGAGTVITKAAPDGDTELVNDAVKFVTPDVSYLQHSEESLKAEEDAIVKNSVGAITTPREALNELQVEAAFEDRKDVLLDEAREMANIRREIIDCLMRFRYGDRYIQTDVSLGREFYIYSVADLEQRKKMLIENGASQTELMQLQEKIINTEYKTNPFIQKRLITLLNLEPMPLLNLEQTNNLLQSGILTKEDFEKKIKFDKLVRRFEREQGNITEFVVDAPFDRRIELIDNILNGYLDEERNNDRELRQRVEVPVSNRMQEQDSSETFEDVKD